MKKLLFVFGTRPEAIKMAPLIKEAKNLPEYFETKVCVTAQHRQMLDQVLSFFDISPDYDLDLMQPNQTLFSLTAKAVLGMEPILNEYRPDIVIVQGDTTSAMVGALCAFYVKSQVAHIEAGLRSRNKYSPFPEEINRILVGHIADYHFAPTPAAANSLRKEGIQDNVHVVGNTVIDALFLGLNIINRDDSTFKAFFSGTVNTSKRIILVTGHRRESFGTPFENICYAIKDIAKKFDDVQIVYPVHLNPNVQEPVKRILKDVENVALIEPLDYPYLLWLMNKSFFVLTDSGGIQEEAPSLGKPVLVMRDVTERMEGVEAGTAVMVGTDRDRIVSTAIRLLTDKAAYEAMSRAINPYGDGTTSIKVFNLLRK
jgi:UDP-N-acetylglucosamine 2-epimerase (non-hydrolysing)